ncbi:cyclic nucleotide-binding/CBS domain-containing protein [Halovenus rubra]|uniref:Cyclic nucleotide-binding/CBS domain-containing protein n=2 Tax=Halovenus rubra TaxID=869890 RepID=A0ABD5X7A8_9EURY|nr:CBS domain-containing protein [Halovenus rubra]
MQVAEIMSSPPVTVGPDTTLREASGVMLEEHVGSTLVVDNALVGILTRSDVLRATYAMGESLAELPVARGMSEDVVTTAPETSIRHALELMKAEHIKKLPLIEDFELVGIVTATDIAVHQPKRVQEVKSAIGRQDNWTD